MNQVQQRVLVYGAGGVQGGAVVEQLLGAGHAVRALIRSERAAERLRRAGAEVITADLGDPASLVTASTGVDAVVLIVPIEFDAARAVAYGRNAIDAARTAGVRLLVFNTGTRIPASPTNVAGFEIKRQIEAYLWASGVPAIVLRPTFYMENFAGPWTAPAIVQHATVAYPIPRALRAAWISAADAAAFTVAALERPALAGSTFEIGGPEALDGAAIAAHFSAAQGRPVSYIAIPLDSFEQQLSPVIGPHNAAELVQMYRWMEAQPDSTLFTADQDALRQALPVALTPLERWVQTQDWQVPVGA